MADEFKDIEYVVNIENARDRIAARKLRIERKQQEIKGILPQIKVVVAPPKRSQLQCAKSDDRLEKILGDTSALVANVKNAAVTYENERKSQALKACSQRLDVLEQEGQVGAEHFKDIARGWQDTLRVTVPSDLYQQLVDQKNACEAVIYEKDKLIQDLQNAMEEKGLQYDQGIVRQEVEVQMSIDRGHDQIRLLKRCYSEELDNIEGALVEEWKELQVTQKKLWEEALARMSRGNTERLDSISQLFGKWETELDELRRNKANELSGIRVELEKDIDNLELFLHDLRFVLGFNEEKLEYGFQVLRKRDEEQIVVRANQKRWLTKLKDCEAELKAVVDRTENEKKESARRVNRDCNSIRQKIMIQQRKFSHFHVIDNEKLDELWRLNDETARKLIDELLLVDKEIHERLLGLQWQAPDLSILLKADDASKTDVEARTCLLQSAPIYAKPLRCASLFRIGMLVTRRRLQSRKRQNAAGKELMFIPQDVRWNILRNLVEETSFLIDARLEHVIRTLPPEEQTLVQLDAILSALNLRSESEIGQLIEYIFDKCYVKFDVNDSKDKLPGDEAFNRQDDDIANSDVALTKLSTSASRDFHEMDSGQMLKAINEFLVQKENVSFHRRSLEKIIDVKAVHIPKEIDWEWRCNDYWTQFLHVLPVTRKELWNTLFEGLGKLRQVMLQRYNLSQAILELQTHNAELKLLLANYVQSRKVHAHKHG